MGMGFMDGFSDELIKLSTDVTGSLPTDKPEGETFKGKPVPLNITPKKDIAPRQLVTTEPKIEKQPGPAKRKVVLWSNPAGRGVGLRFPIKLP